MARDHYYTRDLPSMDGSIPRTGGAAVAKFTAEDVRDVAKSKALGRPAYRKVDMVEIINPGDPQNIVKRRVREADKERFANAWAAYQKLEEATPDGTLLEHFPMLSKGQIEHLKYNSVFTVEQLASVPDTALQNLGLGSRRMREHAKAFLETAERGKVPAKLVEDNEALRNQVTLLTEQLNDMMRKVELFASKAGENVSEIDVPAATVVAEVEAKNKELSKNILSDLPEDWEFLSLPELKVHAMKVTDEKVKSKAQAVDVIKEYLSMRD